MSLRDSKRERTARQIRAAARGLFLAQGFESTTMEQVAAEAGVSRASLFNYFPGKSSLLEGLGQDLEGRLVRAVEHYRGKHQQAPQALAQLFAYTARVLEQTARLTRLLFMQRSEGAGFAALQEAFTSLAEAGQAQGSWRRDLPAKQLGEVLYLGYVAGLLDWCVEGERGAQLRRRAEALNRLLAG